MPSRKKFDLKMEIVVFICFAFVITSALPSDFKIQKTAASLIICSFNGNDKGVKQALRELMLGVVNPFRLERCILGCQVSWIFGSNYLYTYFTGDDKIIDMLQYFARTDSRFHNLGVKRLMNIYNTVKECVIGGMEDLDKCNLDKKVPKCFAQLEFPAVVTAEDLISFISRRKFNREKLRTDATFVGMKFVEKLHKLMDFIDGEGEFAPDGKENISVTTGVNSTQTKGST